MLIDDIKHLSFSSVTKFKNAPAVWIVEYLYKTRGDVGPAAWRGSAVEAGVDQALYDDSDNKDKWLAAAYDRFELDAQGEASDKVEAERANIAPMLYQALPLMKPFGLPLARQIKIEHRLDGVALPLIGYVDYSFPSDLVDLKTTLRMPSTPRPDHLMQVALYQDATGRKPWLAYVTPKKGQLYEITKEDAAAALSDFRMAARALCNALSKFRSSDEMASVYAPDFSQFYWDELTMKKAREVWAA